MSWSDEVKEEIEKLQEIIYSYQNKVREEMKHHFFRFVELEQKFQEVNSHLVNLEVKFKLTQNDRVEE